MVGGKCEMKEKEPTEKTSVTNNKIIFLLYTDT